MSTTLRYRSPDLAPEADRQRGILSRRTGPWVLVGLVFALVFVFAGGGGMAFYEAIYLRAVEAEHILIGAPGAPLSGLRKKGNSTEQIRLQGILYGADRSLAVINEANCAPGERVTIRVGDNTRIIRCVEVYTHEVTIETADGVIEWLRLTPPIAVSAPVEPVATEP